jgi:hypothetical protein
MADAATSTALARCWSGDKSLARRTSRSRAPATGRGPSSSAQPRHLMLLPALAIAAQLAAAPRPTPAPVLLAFPDPALDDTAAYPGYRSQLYQDAAGNTLHVYLSSRDQRVVHVWADHENESLAFTVRAPGGTDVPLAFAPGAATAARQGRWRTLSYVATATAPHIEIGQFLLGSMRVERDVQYWGRHKEPFTAPPFVLAEFDTLVQTIAALPPARQRAHLALLNAPSAAALAARLQPTVTRRTVQGLVVLDARKASLDGRDSLRLEITLDPRRVEVVSAGRGYRISARGPAPISLAIRVATTGRALTALARDEIFAPEFLRFLAAEWTAVSGRPATDPGVLRVRRMERQVLGVELLASREKLMAGLPTYATYFGRDMLVSALMMQPIWRPEMAEYVIGAALGKLGPDGGVSHEEALGEQATREAAADYIRTVRAATSTSSAQRADSLWTVASALLRTQRVTRENHHMVDDEFQLPIMVARWLADPRATAASQRAFLRARSVGGVSHLHALLRELELVAERSAPYARDPRPLNLVAFGRRDSLWASQSWRDSGAGYGNGRFAMDVNAAYVPQALAAVADILTALPRLGIPLDSLQRVHPSLAPSTALGAWARDTSALRRAITTWQGALTHFVVRAPAEEVDRAIAARLATLPADERAWWTAQSAGDPSRSEPFTFLALSLDSLGRPVAAINSDPATRLFLERGLLDSASVMRDVRPFADRYPRGLLIDGVGPMVTNDVLASPAVWRAFDADPYHGPRVAWGREVNLFVLGVSQQITLLPPTRTEYRRTLRAAIDRVVGAVEASGFHAELWSYTFRDGRPRPARYGSGNDLQLWSTTDLVVQYVLSTLR